MNEPKGKIECHYTITCGKCSASDKITGSMPSEVAIQKWRSFGWLHTITNGWICPKHNYNIAQR